MISAAWCLARGAAAYAILGWQLFLESIYMELPPEQAATLAPPGKSYEVVPITEIFRGRSPPALRALGAAGPGRDSTDARRAGGDA